MNPNVRMYKNHNHNHSNVKIAKITQLSHFLRLPLLKVEKANTFYLKSCYQNSVMQASFKSNSMN